MRVRSATRASIAASQRRVLILALPPVDALDVIGPAEVFGYANRLYGGERVPYLLELVSSGTDPHIPSEAGIDLRAHRSLQKERLSKIPIDTLIVASGTEVVNRMDIAAVAWIRARSKDARRVCSICVGAFALAEAGLLDGRRATTHWRVAQQLADRYPRVEVDPNPIWIKDDNIYTSAGVSSGIDLALALVEEDLGAELALQIAKDLVLFLRRPGGQAQFSVAMQSQESLSPVLEGLCQWIGEHLMDDLTVDALADRLSKSRRTVIRMFHRELKTTPGKYVEEVRIEAVRRAIELRGDLSEKAVRRYGYQSLDVLRKVFRRRLGVSPTQYARQFAQTG